MTSEALVLSILLNTILQSCWRFRGLPVRKTTSLLIHFLVFQQTVANRACWCFWQNSVEITFIKLEAGVRGRGRHRVVEWLLSEIVTGVHVGSKFHQQLDHVHHVGSSGVVQSRLMKIHWIHIGTCTKDENQPIQILELMSSHYLQSWKSINTMFNVVFTNGDDFVFENVAMTDAVFDIM